MPHKKKPRITKVCKHCKKEFQVIITRPDRVFCSIECRNKHGTRTVDLIDITCPTCGIIFKVLPNRAKKRKYCSRECSNKRDPNKTIVKKCPQCDKEFSYTFYGRHKKHCSRECLLNSVRRKEQQCPQCGKIFMSKSHRKKKVYCSPKCQALGRRSRVSIICLNCGKKFTTQFSKRNRRKYCSKKCQMLSMFSSAEEQKVIKIVSEILNENPRRQHTFDWLRNITGRRMRVDAYFPTSRLILEYDGRQHREFFPLYHKTKKQFVELKRRDRLKEKLIAEHEIKLIRISDKEPKTRKHIIDRLLPIFQKTLA